jgi:DNA polymerase-3 subunit alpha
MRLLFLDTETTGLPKYKRINALEKQGNWPDIVSIAWSVYHDQTHISSKYFVLKPHAPIPADSTRIHGITTEYATEHGHDMRTVLENLAADLKETDCAIAHNMEFDKNVIFNAYRWSLNMNPWLIWPREELCTMNLSTNELKLPSKFADSKSFKPPTLSELYRATFNKDPPTGLHNSMKDVEVLSEIYLKRWLATTFLP